MDHEQTEPTWLEFLRACRKIYGKRGLNVLNRDYDQIEYEYIGKKYERIAAEFSLDYGSDISIVESMNLDMEGRWPPLVQASVHVRDSVREYSDLLSIYPSIKLRTFVSAIRWAKAASRAAEGAILKYRTRDPRLLRVFLDLNAKIFFE